MNCEEATKLMAGYLDGELDPITSQTPRCGPTPERGVFAKTRVEKQQPQSRNCGKLPQLAL